MRFDIERSLGLIGSRETVAAIVTSVDPRIIAMGWQSDLQAFTTLRAKYLLYP